MNALTRLIRPCPIFHGKCVHVGVTLLHARSGIQRTDLAMIVASIASVAKLRNSPLSPSIPSVSEINRTPSPGSSAIRAQRLWARFPALLPVSVSTARHLSILGAPLRDSPILECTSSSAGARQPLISSSRSQRRGSRPIFNFGCSLLARLWRAALGQAAAVVRFKPVSVNQHCLACG